MGGRKVFLRYCTVAGDEVATTWERARADLIVEGLPVRVSPTYRGQRSFGAVTGAARTAMLVGMFEGRER